ncbi:MAG TPA: GNAT family protein [Xanthobacteraceae bacterium]|nr:GNAT family protein [Xanthobacteraceae bacterium]
MALFRSVVWSEPLPILEGEGVFLRMPQMADFAEWARLRAESRAFLSPWEPTWPADDLTRGAFRRRMRRHARELREDLGYPFLVFRTADRVLVGGVTLSNVRRGVAQAANLGYWVGAPHMREGYMTAAVAALVRFAHGQLRLRRIEAACLPNNAASVRLLEKLNFVREGYAREYLCIAGIWQDHLMYAHLADDPVLTPRQ